ncbi:MAG: hypothetical protein QG592_2006, partial [Pseudomonadota bacterium]|nr:hypothetical protein [Pseudomonadota bacterium]
ASIKPRAMAAIARNCLDDERTERTD